LIDYLGQRVLRYNRPGLPMQCFWSIKLINGLIGVAGGVCMVLWFRSILLRHDDSHVRKNELPIQTQYHFLIHNIPQFKKEMEIHVILQYYLYKHG